MRYRAPTELDGFREGAARGFMVRADILGKELNKIKKELREATATFLGWDTQDWEHYNLMIVNDQIFFYDTRLHKPTQEGTFEEILQEEV